MGLIVCLSTGNIVTDLSYPNTFSRPQYWTSLLFRSLLYFTLTNLCLHRHFLINKKLGKNFSLLSQVSMKRILQFAFVRLLFFIPQAWQIRSFYHSVFLPNKTNCPKKIIHWNKNIILCKEGCVRSPIKQQFRQDLNKVHVNTSHVCPGLCPKLQTLKENYPYDFLW